MREFALRSGPRATSPLRRNPVPLGGPAEPVLAPLSLQREDGALRIDASRDPVAARHFDRALEDLAATGLHAFRGRVDVVDIEIVEPIWDRLHRTLGKHAAD